MAHKMTKVILVRQYAMGELEFRMSPGTANPWTGVDLTAVFTGPENQLLRLAGFYDGTDRWAIRFCLPAQGVWTYRTECRRLPDLDGREGTVDVQAPLGGNPIDRHGGILKADPAHHCLTYTDGSPFFWLGDTWWFCPSDHIPLDSSNRADVPSMVRNMLDVRREQGFTVLHMAFLRAIRGTEALAFTKTLQEPDFDVGYWQTADTYIALANESGLIPALAVGWSVNFNNYSLEELRHVWRYVMARYGSFNVTWLICGEYNVVKEGEPSEPMEKALALGRYIKEIDPYRRAMSVHPWYHVGDKHQAWTEAWCDFIMIQGGHWGDGNTPPASVYLEAYRTGKPCLEGETNYEAIHAGHPVTPTGVRLCAYHSIQHGGFGFTYGSHGLWYPNENEADTTFSEWGKTRPWWVALKDAGADHLGHLRKLYESLPWWTLQPWPDAISIASQDPATRRPCAKGCLSPLTIVVYFPQGFPYDEPVWIRLAKPVPGVLKGSWFDPRTGKSTDVSLGTLESGTDLLLPPRPSDEDWVLTIVQSAKNEEVT
jgi:hypothetical protein